MVIPVVKQYKSESKTYRTLQNRHELIKQKHKDTYNKLKSLQHKNRKTIEAFEKEWNKEVFLEKAKVFFIKSELKLLNNNADKPHFTTYEFDATTQMKSPENFYRFMDALHLMPFVIQTDFPILFHSDGNLISGVFRIKVYHEKKADKNVSKDKIESNNKNTTK